MLDKELTKIINSNLFIMNTEEKIKLVAQMLQAMGLASTDGEKFLTIKKLAKELGVGVEISQNTSGELTDSLKNFSVIPVSSLAPTYAKYKGEIIGIMFCLNGKHFVFYHKDRYSNMNRQEVEIQIEHLEAICGQRWRIPTTAEFEEVQRHLRVVNQIAPAIGGQKLDSQEYMEICTPRSKRVPHVRLVLPAPWLD